MAAARPPPIGPDPANRTTDSDRAVQGIESVSELLALLSAHAVP